MAVNIVRTKKGKPPIIELTDKDAEYVWSGQVYKLGKAKVPYVCIIDRSSHNKWKKKGV